MTRCIFALLLLGKLLCAFIFQLFIICKCYYTIYIISVYSLLSHLTSALFVPDAASLQQGGIELNNSISFHLLFYNPQGTILLYNSSQSALYIGLNSSRLTLVLANYSHSAQLQVLTPVSPGVRYSIEIDGLGTGLPTVIINGASPDVAVTGAAVLPPGTGTLNLGDITAVDIQVDSL